MNNYSQLAAIEFGSLPMLGWLAAAALPWLISLWNRRRRKRTPWAAVDLLLIAIRRSSRRLKLQQWLLLALRTAILVLVALAAAEPFWRSGSATLVEGARTHHVLVVDRSLSMTVQTDGSTRLDRAKAHARQMIAAAPAGDCFTVIAWSELAENVLGRPVFDASSALAAVDAVESRDTRAKLEAAVDAVVSAVKRAQRELPDVPRHHAVFLSDMTAATWDRSTVAEPLIEAFGDDVDIELVDCDDLRRDNFAITRLALDPPPAVIDQTTGVAAEIRNFGAAPRTVTLELLVDGGTVDQRKVDLPESNATIERFNVPFASAGSHSLEVRVTDDADAMATDNRRYLAVEVRPAVRAACFYSAPGAADDVARALNPRGDSSGVVVDKLPIARLESTRLADYDALILCNVGDPSQREARLLEQYVNHGGAAMIWLGDQVRADVYNQRLGEVLPVTIRDLAVEGDWRLDPLGYEHPILKPFAGRERSGLLGVRISRYFRVEVEESIAAARIALALSSGDPAIVVGDFGAGRVAVIATDPALRAANEPWSTLAVSPSFLPLVRELFAHLTSERRIEQRNVLAGEPAPIAVQRQGSCEVVTPRGDTLRLRSQSPGASLLFANTADSGFYEVRSTGGAASGSPAQRFAVNVDPRESDLSAATLPELPESIAVGPVRASASRQLQQPLLWIAAALALIELAVAWLFGRARA